MQSTQNFYLFIKIMITNTSKHCVAVGKHYGKLRELARQVKTSNKDAIEEAACLMCEAVPNNSVLVPIPGHEGDATYTYLLAKAIADKRHVQVVDAIQGFRRESSHEAKLKGRCINSQVWFYKIENISEGPNIIFIDNVVATGRTCQAARHALGDRGTTLSITIADY